MNSNLVYICDKTDSSARTEEINPRIPHKYFDTIYKHSPTTFPTVQIAKNKHQIIINDINIGSINHFVLDLHLPALCGINEVSWCKYFGYKIIKEIVFKIDDEIIYVLDSMAILASVLNHPKSNEILQLAGETDIFRTIKKGIKSYDILIPEEAILVYIPTCFDNYIRFGSCSALIKSKKKLTIEIEFNELMDCINYIGNINFDKELQMRKIQLLSCTFNKLNKSSKEYIETISTYKFNINDTNINIPFSNFSKIKWMYVYNNKKLIYYPKKQCTDEEYKYKFEKYMAVNTFLIKKNDKNHPSLQIVEKNQIKLEETGNIIKVYIDNIPDGYSLYYNPKVLYFRNKKLSEMLNFSEKFIKVIGTYSLSQKKIKFEKISSSFNWEDISIPADIWNSDINDEGGDNRIKKKDYIINDINIGGKDIFGNIVPVSFTNIKLGNRVIFEDSHAVKINNIISTDAWNKINKLEIIPKQTNFIFKNILPIEEQDIRTIIFDLTLKNTKNVYKTDISIYIFVYGNKEL